MLMQFTVSLPVCTRCVQPIYIGALTNLSISLPPPQDDTRYTSLHLMLMFTRIEYTKVRCVAFDGAFATYELPAADSHSCWV